MFYKITLIKKEINNDDKSVYIDATELNWKIYLIIITSDLPTKIPTSVTHHQDINDIKR